MFLRIDRLPVELPRSKKIDPESALRRANEKFTKRFTALEDEFLRDGRSIHDATLEQMEEVWQRVKAVEG